MGEIDTTPFEPVHVAIFMLEEKSDQKRRHSSASSDSENDKERNLEGLMKELAYYKLELEAKDSAQQQTLLQLEHYQKSADELSACLENSKAEREKSTEECKQAYAHINELESKIEEMGYQMMESEAKIEDLTGIYNALRKVDIAKQNSVEELKAEILMIKQAASESEKEKNAEIELLLAAEVNSSKRLEVMEDLENQVLEKLTLIDSLQLELKQANEVLISNEQAMNDFAILKADTKFLEGLEIENGQLRIELYRANSRIEILAGELQKAKLDIDKVKEKDNDLQIEVAILKSEVHKYRSKIAAEVRSSGYYLVSQETNKIQFSENNETKSGEIESLRKELETTKARIADFRTRAEQAITRADVAERAKFALEGQLRKYKEQRQRRKKAFEALKEECVSVYNPPSYNTSPTIYQPLGEILSMEF